MKGRKQNRHKKKHSIRKHWLLLSLLKERPELMDVLFREEDWETFQSGERLPEETGKRMLDRISKEARLHVRKKRTEIYLPGWYAIAGLLLMVASLTVFWKWQWPALRPHNDYTHVKASEDPRWASIRNDADEPRKILLKDGSIVWLHKAGAIRFPDPMPTGKRPVYLEGKARFDVAHDPARPFTVHMDGFATTALGTAFTVTALPGQQDISVLLHSGKVSLWREKGPKNQVVYLTKPGQIGLFNRLKASIVMAAPSRLARVPRQEAIAWQDAVMTIRDAPLNQVIDTLSRRYKVLVQFDRKALEKISYTGTIDTKTEKINDILDMICTLNGLALMDNGDQDYLIKSK